MSRRNVAHLVNALADRRMIDNRVISAGRIKTHEDRRELEKVELRIDTELSRLGLERYDIDDFEEEVREEVSRRRYVQRKHKQTVTYDFSDMLKGAGLMGAR